MGEENARKGVLIMALTRKSLKAMGLTDEQVDSIIEMHTETVDGLKAYKADAEKLPGVQAELDQAKKDLAEKSKDGWKDKHDAVKKEFDDYKAAQTAKDTKAAKETAYRALLKEVGVAEKRIDTILRVTDLDKIELEDGKVKSADEVKNTIKTEWAEFITAAGQVGADMAKPPVGNVTNTGTRTKDEILGIKDGAARRQAMLENPTLFGLPDKK